MNVLMVLCLYLTVFHIPFDFFATPVADDEQIWFGLTLRGWAAKVTTPLHWAVYAAGVYGFWRMRPWMWPWAAVWAAQVAGAIFVWSVLQLEWPRGPLVAPFVAIPMVIVAVTLWNARDRFQTSAPALAERYGRWGLVTGASSGIGREFVHALAREGLSCVVTARRGDELERLAHDVAGRHGVEIRVVVADLARERDVQRLIGEIRDLDFGILVSNAGAGYMGRLDRQDPARLADIARLGCVAPVALVTAVAARMVERGRGAILIVGSVAGRTPLPLHAVYSATKAFGEFLGKALWAELRPLGVDVLVVEPGPVDTAFQNVAGEVRDDPGIAPRLVVDRALSALGRRPAVVCGTGLSAASWLARVLPSSLVLHLTADVTRKATPRELR